MLSRMRLIGLILGIVMCSGSLLGQNLDTQRIQQKSNQNIGANIADGVVPMVPISEQDARLLAEGDFPPDGYALKEINAKKARELYKKKFGKKDRTVLFIISAGIDKSENINLLQEMVFCAGCEPGAELPNGNILAHVAGGLGKNGGLVGANSGVEIVSLKITRGNQPAEAIYPLLAAALRASAEYVIRHNLENPSDKIHGVILADFISVHEFTVVPDVIELCDATGIPIVTPAGDQRIDIGHYTLSRFLASAGGDKDSFDNFNNIVPVGNTMFKKTFSTDTNIADGLVHAYAPGTFIKFGPFYYNSSSISAAYVAASLTMLVSAVDGDHHTAIARVEKSTRPLIGVVNKGGLLDMNKALKSKEVLDLRPINRYKIPEKGIVGEKVIFSAGESSDQEGKPLNYRIYFIDNGDLFLAQFEEREVGVTFNEPGSFLFAVIVNDGFRDSKLTLHPVTISPTNFPPNVGFDSLGYESVDGESVTLTWQVSDPENDPLKLTLVDGITDEKIPVDGMTSFVIQTPVPGQFSMKLIAEDPFATSNAFTFVQVKDRFIGHLVTFQAETLFVDIRTSHPDLRYPITLIYSNISQKVQMGDDGVYHFQSRSGIARPESVRVRTFFGADETFNIE